MAHLVFQQLDYLLHDIEADNRVSGVLAPCCELWNRRHGRRALGSIPCGSCGGRTHNCAFGSNPGCGEHRCYI